MLTLVGLFKPPLLLHDRTPAELTEGVNVAPFAPLAPVAPGAP